MYIIHVTFDPILQYYTQKMCKAEVRIVFPIIYILHTIINISGKSVVKQCYYIEAIQY